MASCPSGQKLARVCSYVKAPAEPSYHEAKPRRETRIGQGPARVLGRDISAIFKRIDWRRELFQTT